MIIGLDVGGTHTDAVLLGNNGLEKEIKVLTDPSNLFHSVTTALDGVTSDIDPRTIKRIVLSTTLTTNAIVQKRLPDVGIIVSSGPGIDPEFYRTNENYFAVSGSIDHRGRQIEPIDSDEIRKIAQQLQTRGIRYIGVIGKFSIRNPAHEIQIKDMLSDAFEKIFMGHRISGSLNFSRRIATTYLNAAVYPIHKEFYAAVQQSLETKGLAQPIRLLKADGGNMSLESSIEFPAQTILSGPAASVMGAVTFGSQDEDTLVMDIGGTTTDMAILIQGAPVLNPLGIRLGNYKTLIRSLETLSIGLGGDSAVKAMDGGLEVGPERLGPAMAYGGPAPTLTDALFITGDLTDGDHQKSINGLEPLAKHMEVSIEAIADRILELSCNNILSAAQSLIDRINGKPVYTVHELQEGYLVRPTNILVLGGPAPHIAKYLKKNSDYTIRVVPRWHVANAIGASLARTTCEVILFADTERRIAEAPEENFNQQIDGNFTGEAAQQQAFQLLRDKAIQRGANPDYLEMEVVEALQFNMVRGFRTTGKNIRVKVQVKPGLIHGYEDAIRKLSAE
ncbi:MAG: hydantoinase/oxoprolinase family protein [Desulfobacterales bacterium]|jgi:N-methylhydantoinase A/oxoprolinase/acetone carboxylase beta subunit